MELMQDDVQYVARNLLGFFKEEKIRTVDDLAALAGNTHPVNERDMVRIEQRPSLYGTTVLTVTYIGADSATPVQLRINPSLHYGVVFIKSNSPLIGFEPHRTVKFGVIQSRQTAPLLEALCRELTLIEAGLRSFQ